VISSDAAIIDVEGGASRLVDSLLERGFRRVAILDLSAKDGASRNIPGLPPEIQRVSQRRLGLSDGAKTDKSPALVLHFISDGLKVDRVSLLQPSER
jgi:hypothetical protein